MTEAAFKPPPCCFLTIQFLHDLVIYFLCHFRIPVEVEISRVSVSCSWHSSALLYCPVYLPVDITYAKRYACAMQRVSMRNLSCLPCATGRKPSARFVCLKSLSLPYILHLFGSDNPGKLPESRNYFIAFALGKFLIFFANGTVCLPRLASKLVLV